MTPSETVVVGDCGISAKVGVELRVMGVGSLLVAKEPFVSVVCSVGNTGCVA